MSKIFIESCGKMFEFDADFFDNPTSRKILEFLPIESTVRLWGEEIYFDTGIQASSLEATTDVDVGDLAYWPQGKCLCIFFGPTPVSTSAKPVPASEVVIVGKISSEVNQLRQVKSGSKIKVV